MVYEYAIDPAALNCWERVRYFLDQLGVQHGRLLSRFPESWKKLVYSACAACPDVERKRIEQRLAVLGPELLRSWRAFNPTLCWLENAKASHVERAFHAVITDSAVDGHDFIRAAAEVSEVDPLWHTERRKRVRRTAKAMTECAVLLLSFARELLFVDAHFSPWKRRYELPFLDFMAVVSRRRPGQKPSRIEFHLSAKKVETDHYEVGKTGSAVADFEAECRRHIGRHLPKGLAVRFVLWRERRGGDQLHARYLLTELGGVDFNAGLDEVPGRTTDVALLEAAFRWDEYQIASSSVFELAHEFVVP